MCHLPITNPDTMFQQFLQELPQDYESLAYQFKAFTRPRKVNTPLQLLRLVFLYSGLDQTLRETAAIHTLLYGSSLTDEAVKKRLLACRPWVKAMLAQLLPTHITTQLQAGRRLLVTDGSTIQGLASTGVDWRLHITIDLFQLEFVQFEITDSKAGEHLHRAAAQRGDIVLADRGYFRTKQLLELSAEGVDLIVRMSPQLVVLKTPSLDEFDLIAELKAQPHRKIRTFEVFVGERSSEHGVRGWVHARRIPQIMADEQRRKLRKRRKKSGRTPKQESLYLCGWILVFTTLPPEVWPVKQIFELYRCRWQVELSIKKLKSLLNLSQVRCQEGSVLGEFRLLGKLLYSALLVKKTRSHLPGEWSELSENRVGTDWRPLKMAHMAAIPVVSGAQFWKEECWNRALEVLRERRRGRKLQTLPPGIFDPLSSRDTERVTSKAL